MRKSQGWKRPIDFSTKYRFADLDFDTPEAIAKLKRTMGDRSPILPLAISPMLIARSLDGKVHLNSEAQATVRHRSLNTQEDPPEKGLRRLEGPPHIAGSEDLPRAGRYCVEHLHHSVYQILRDVGVE
jgi:hypothetical protein